MSIFPALLPSQSLGPKVCERDRLPQAEKPAAEDQALHDAAEGVKQREDVRVHYIHSHRSYPTHRCARIASWPVPRIACITDIFVVT